MFIRIILDRHGPGNFVTHMEDRIFRVSHDVNTIYCRQFFCDGDVRTFLLILAIKDSGILGNCSSIVRFLCAILVRIPAVKFISDPVLDSFAHLGLIADISEGTVSIYIPIIIFVTRFAIASHNRKVILRRKFDLKLYIYFVAQRNESVYMPTHTYYSSIVCTVGAGIAEPSYRIVG